MLTHPHKSHRKAYTAPAYSAELAEFCGIMLGDGGIATYQTTITLHAEEQAYCSFVSGLVMQLFGVTPNQYAKKDCLAVTLILSRIGIVEFLTTVCELPRGNKKARGIDIPRWIKGDGELEIACVRGLFDTDGSVFTHRYRSGGKLYQYKKLSFTSVSPSLLSSVQVILARTGIRSRFGSRHDLRIDAHADVSAYFKIFGSHNDKHLKRYTS